MKTLEQIKDEVAKENGFNTWEGYCFAFGGFWKIIEPKSDEAARRYAQQVAEEVRQRCAKNAKLVLRKYNELGEVSEDDLGQEITTETEKDYIGISKDSILNTEIILP